MASRAPSPKAKIVQGTANSIHLDIENSIFHPTNRGPAQDSQKGHADPSLLELVDGEVDGCSPMSPTNCKGAPKSKWELQTQENSLKVHLEQVVQEVLAVELGWLVHGQSQEEAVMLISWIHEEKPLAQMLELAGWPVLKQTDDLEC